VLLLARGASAAPPEDANAATWYRKAMERFAAAGLTDAERATLDGYDPRSGARPSVELRALLARLEPAFNALRRGAAEDFSDFELDYAQGLDLVLPHLQPLRDVAFLMQRDAAVRLYDGDGAGAAGDIASIYRMSAHVSQDGVLISSLVGQSLFRVADRITQQGLDSAALPPEVCATLLAGLESMPRGDPFGVVGCLLTERDVVMKWLRDRYDDEHARGRMAEDLGLDGEDAIQLDALLLVDGEREAALDAADEVMGRAVEAFLSDDPAEARLTLECLNEEVRRGEHGAIAAVLLPSYLRLYESMSEGRSLVSGRIELLRSVATGERPASSLVNAAVWYLRAVEMIQALDAEFRGQLPRLAAGSKRVEEGPAQHLASAAAIVETLRQGAQAPRCDFAIAGGKAAAVPAYLPGIREALQLLQADALRLLAAGDRAAAADRLATSLRLGAHLAGDPQIAQALVAHAGFEASAGIVERAGGLLEAEEKAAIRAALAAMPARDPFGYMGALARARRDVLKALHPAGAAPPALERTVEDAGNDALFYLLVLATRRGDDEDLPAAWQPLGDVLALEALREARSRAAGAIAALAESGQVSGLVPDPVPVIGRVRERHARAMQDYRAALSE
jgi:hypothetical protein